MKDLLVCIEFILKLGELLPGVLSLLLLYEVELLVLGQLGRQASNIISQLRHRLHQPATQHH